MRRDPTQFRERFKRWKEGLPAYKNGRAISTDEEWDPNDTYTADAGMIKSKLAIASHFGNPTARRMTNYDSRDYTWPGEYEYIDGIGELKRGNVYVGSYDNLVTPLIQDNGKTLEFVDDLWNPKNEKRSYKQSLKFNKMRDAWSFGENYKKYAPMMNRYRHGKDSYMYGKPVEDEELPKYGNGKIPKRARAMYNLIDPTRPYPEGFLEAALIEADVRLKMLKGDQDRKEWEVGPTLGDSVSDAAWRKRLGYDYNNKFIIPNKDGSYRLPKLIEAEIPTDTTMLKLRISDNEKLMKDYRDYRYDPYMREAVRVDKETLDSLRKTYKTGKPVVINEQSYNNRHWLQNGYINASISPLNVLQNYTIQYDKNNNRMNYFDVYDFNEYDWAIPGKPFNIKGYIDLTRPIINSK